MKKYIITSAVLLAVAVPAISFAANSTSTGTLGNTVKNFVQKKKQEREIPQAVQDALTASGITVPTTEQMQAFREQMQAVHTAIQSLSDADKASLEAIREEAKLKEREFLRSKGVALPTEAEIAEMEKNKEAIHAAMQAAGYEGKGMKGKGMKGEGMGMKGNGKGPRGGEGFGGRGMRGGNAPGTTTPEAVTTPTQTN